MAIRLVRADPDRPRAGNSPRGTRATAATTPQMPVTVPQLSLLSAREMRTIVTRPTRDRAARVEQQCARCEEHGPKGCPACTMRRKKVVRLLERGTSIPAMAEEMRLSIGRVGRLIEQDRDRRELEALTQSHIDNRIIRELFERQKAIEPELTVTELAHRAEMDPSYVFELLGYKPTSETRRPDGRLRAQSSAPGKRPVPSRDPSRDLPQRRWQRERALPQPGRHQRLPAARPAVRARRVVRLQARCQRRSRARHRRLGRRL
jgi:hypothetical protein